MPRTVAARPDHGGQRAVASACSSGCWSGRRSAACWSPTSASAGASLVDVVGLVVATALFVAMRRLPAPRRDRRRPASPGIGEGLRYAVRRRDLLGTYLVDIAAMFLAMPGGALPGPGEEVFDRPELLGLLYSAETVGALLATALSGWTARVHHHGRAIVIAAAAYGGCIALAGLVPSHLAGRAVPRARRRRRHDLRRLPRHDLEPDHPRRDARPAGRHRDAVLLRRPARRPGPRRPRRRPVVGARRRSSSGGLACVAGVLLTAVWLRDFWAYDARTDEHAVAEREVRARRQAEADAQTPTD